MATKTVEIDVPLWYDRYMPASVALDTARLYGERGVVEDSMRAPGRSLEIARILKGGGTAAPRSGQL